MYQIIHFHINSAYIFQHTAIHACTYVWMYIDTYAKYRTMKTKTAQHFYM